MPRHKVIDQPSIPLPQFDKDNPNPYYNGTWGRRRVSEKQKIVFQKDNWMCRVCGSFEDLTIDHIIPWCRGGRNEPHNLQTLCSRCNTEKGSMMPATWLFFLKNEKGIDFKIVRVVREEPRPESFIVKWNNKMQLLYPMFQKRILELIKNQC